VESRRQEFTVVVADDSADDVLVFERALRECQHWQLIQAITNGQELMRYFSGAGKYADRSKHPLPDVLVLDVRMPHGSGFDFLEWLGERPQIRPKRIVIWTGAARSEDIVRSHQLGVHFIMQKSRDITAVRELCGRIERSLMEFKVEAEVPHH